MLSLPKVVMGLVLAAGVTGAAVASSAQPAQAATFVSAGFTVGVSAGFGAGYAAPRYHWYRWHDGYGWHRRWVAYGWVPPVAYVARPVVYRPAPVWYGRGYDWHDRHDDDRDWHHDRHWH